MFEAGIQVSFLAKLLNLSEVVIVDVRVHSEQTLEDSFNLILESARERHINSSREYILIVYLRLDPIHEKTNVFRCGDSDRFLLLLISPEVFVSWASSHFRAALSSAKDCDASVQQVYLIEEVHRVYCEPFVDLFTCGKSDSLSKITTTESDLRLLVQLVPLGTLRVLLPGLEGLAFIREQSFLHLLLVLVLQQKPF